MKIAFFVLSFFILVGLNAQYFLSGEITEPLNLSDTIIVDGNVSIYGDGKLILAPGSVVLFNGYYGINLQSTGQILAVGTSTDSIIFTSTDTTGFNDYSTTNGAWNGISLINQTIEADSTIFDYCIISYAKKLNGYGAALKIDDANKIRISNSTIQRNVNASFGGGLYLSSQSVIRDNTFYFNLGSKGGAIYCESGQINSCRIIANQAEFWGGGISIIEGSILNSEILYNESQSIGGGIYFGYDNPSMINCCIIGNYAQSGGGLYSCNTSSDIYIIDCHFENNEANIGGAADISSDFMGNNKTYVIGSVFSNNNSTMRGGAVQGKYSSFLNCTFENNSSEHGGAFFSVSCFFNNCIVLNNSAFTGGGLTVFGFDTIRNCLFEGNDAGSFGGGVNNAGSPVFDSCLFFNNTATEFGGGVFTNFEGIFNHCIFDSNQSGQKGGGVYLELDLEIYNCIFTNNKTDGLLGKGGGIYAVDGGRFVNCLIINNHSNYLGGGMYIQNYSTGNYCKVINSTICSNTISDTTNRGAGLYADNDGQYINCVFWGNNSPIYASGFNVYLSYCAIMDIQNADLWNANLDHLIDLDFENNSPMGPNFMAPWENEYTLENNSILINNGNPDTNGLGLPKFDLAGFNRLVMDTVDVGSYEQQFEVSKHKHLDSKFKIFPNPAYHKLEIISSSNIQEINIYSVQGILTLKNEPKENNVILNIVPLTRGLYIIRIRTENNLVKTLKFVKS
jgi:predicted outer membrane repeat protein